MLFVWRWISGALLLAVCKAAGWLLAAGCNCGVARIDEALGDSQLVEHCLVSSGQGNWVGVAARYRKGKGGGEWRKAALKGFEGSGSEARWYRGRREVGEVRREWEAME